MDAETKVDILYPYLIQILKDVILKFACLQGGFQEAVPEQLPQQS